MASNAKSHDIFPVSPTQISQKPDDEGVGLLDNYSSSDQSHSEKGFDGSNDAKHWDPTGRWRKLLIASLAFLALLGLGAAVAFSIHYLQLPRLQPLGELNGLIPEFPVRRMTFTEDSLATPDHKTAESSNATEEYWLSFMPIGNGFVTVDNPERYDLPPPQPDGTYSMSVFHQLHCLHNIMTRFNTLAATVNDPTTNPNPPNDESKGHAHYHIDHCFRYLRQALVCCGDTALEGTNPLFDANAPDHKNPIANGNGAVHVCKDYERIKKWAYEKRAGDEWFI